MTEIALVDNHTEQALGLLISQYQGLPRLSGLVAAITNRLQEFDDCNWDVINKRLLDYTDRNGNPAHAVGAQLDTIGRIVGQGRAGQDDATYLVFIRARIFLNKSRARHDDVIKLLRLVEPAAFQYSEYYPCTVWIQFTEPPTVDAAVLAQLAKRVVTGGVQLFLVETAEEDGLEFGDDTVGGEVDAAHGLSDESEVAGGAIAGIW
jgi:hypothetical protein